MEHPFAKLLPVPVNLGARLAMLLVFMALLCVVLLLFAFLEIMSLAPVDTEKTFAWVVLVLALVVLAGAAVLWLVVQREVIAPLETIAQAVEQEGKGPAGLGHVAAKVLALREKVHSTQAQLDESHETLREVEKLAMVGKLAAGVAHSVRNPLTAVKLRLFSLERSLGLTTRQQQDFMVITDAIKHVDNVVSNFLEFSRRPKVQLQYITFGGALEGCLRLFENRLAAFPVSTTVKRSADLPKVEADPEQLREVIMNVLLNACEAMDYSGNLVLEEFMHEGKDGVDYACVSITDSGPGIAAHDLEHIFVPFFSSKTHGTGLGLPIAKGIMEEHGGDIVVESNPHMGTRFTLMLPVPGKRLGPRPIRLPGGRQSPYLY